MYWMFLLLLQFLCKVKTSKNVCYSMLLVGAVGPGVEVSQNLPHQVLFYSLKSASEPHILLLNNLKHTVFTNACILNLSKQYMCDFQTVFSQTVLFLFFHGVLYLERGA